MDDLLALLLVIFVGVIMSRAADVRDDIKLIREDFHNVCMQAKAVKHDKP